MSLRKIYYALSADDRFERGSPAFDHAKRPTWKASDRMHDESIHRNSNSGHSHVYYRKQLDRM